MPQKINIHGLFIDPETITDLKLQKRISVSLPIFREIETERERGFFKRAVSSKKHVVSFRYMQPYGIILADIENPDPSSYIVNYKQAILDRLLKGFSKTGKNIAGHITEALKMDISGDREYRILQPGRIIKNTTIRKIPAKVHLLNGQWVDVFKSSPDYDFSGGSPYAVTDVEAYSLLINTRDCIYVLYGAGVDATNEEIMRTYHVLIDVYNEIQNKRDELIALAEKEKLEKKAEHKKRINKIELPKIDLSSIKFQAPIVFNKKKEINSELIDDNSNSAETIIGELPNEGK